MTPRVLVGVMTACLLAAAAPKEDATRADLDKMQGDWQCVSYTVDGMRLPEDDAQALFRTVKGDRYTISRFEKTIGTGTIKLDASKDPRQIDARSPLPGGKTRLLRGIYEVRGDTLKLCFGAADKERPKGFTSTPGSGNTLSVWTREKH
jgi:uncharacterized protein (TIGR03067 family)